MSLRHRLGPNTHPKRSLLGLSIILEVGYPQCLGVHNFYASRTDVVGFPGQLGYFLYIGRFEFLWDVNVAERILTPEIIDGYPFDVDDFFAIWERQGEVFVEVTV